MKDQPNSRDLGLRGVATIAGAMGAVVIGAFAIGALMIRRLAIQGLEELTVTRLRAADVAVSDTLKLPEVRA